MEKYLVIIILVVLAYYVHRYCIQIEIEKILKTKEGFAATSGSDADVANSINTLAQIAKDLQAGGITVPGNLNIKAAINTDGSITTKGAINASGGITCNTITSGAITSDTITAKGLVNATNGSRFTGGRHYFQDEENKGRLRVGAAWGKPGIITEDGQDLVLGASSTITHIGPPTESNQHLIINGNLTVKGDIIRNDIYRKMQVAGYIQIVLCLSYIPIYYGYNLIHINHDECIKFRDINPSLPTKYIRNAGDFNGSNSSYFHVKCLNVFPGYKVKLYYGGHSSDNKIFNAGEHESNTQQRLYGAYVVLKDDPDPPPKMNWW